MDQGEKYTSKQGYYPCIYMTLKDVTDTTYEKMLFSMKSESIFSGANNFSVYTVMDDKFSDDFGITREEMKN